MIGECDLCVLVRPMICEKVHKKKKKRFSSVTNYLSSMRIGLLKFDIQNKVSMWRSYY